MSSSTISRLLATIDPLPYKQRQRTLALQARDLAAAGQLDRVLEELSALGWYGRQLALTMAVVVGHTAHVERELADPDPSARARALAAARRLPVSDEAFETVLEDAPAALRQAVYRAVVAGRRQALADRLLVRVRDRWGDREAAALLPACGQETVARWLPDLAHLGVRWGALARRHPGVLVQEARRQLAELPRPLRETWWRRFGAGVAIATPAVPHQVLELLEGYAPPGRLPYAAVRHLGALLDADARRTVRLLVAPGRRQPLRRSRFARRVLRRLARLETPELVTLGRALRPDEQALARLLGALPPSRRGDVFDAITQGEDQGQAVLPDRVLEVLPRQRREQEARRMLTLPAVGDHRSQRWWAMSFLPVAEAAAVLAEGTRRADAGDRAEAYRRLIACAARGRDANAFAEVLGGLTRLATDQEPVRGVALTALAEVHPRLFPAEAAETLERLAVAAIQARDSARGTRAGLGRLATRLLRHHAAAGDPALVRWSLETMRRLAGRTGRIDLGRLDQSLRTGQELAVYDALRPWVDAGVERADFRLVFGLARALGRRAWDLAALQAHLATAVRRGDDGTVREAVGLWLADPRAREGRVEEILRVDRSAVALPEVLGTITARRTDLLDRVLTRRPPAGRFLPKDVRWVPTVPAAHLRRWTPGQHRSYATLLGRVADDAHAPQHARASAIRALGQLPEVGTHAVGQRTTAGEVVLAEAALAALAWTDRPDEALPVLIAHAGGDRARVAVAAARRCARFVRPARLAAVLGDVLVTSAKVTSRKEAVRLAVHLAVPGAMDLVVAAWNAPDQHPDVRIACLSAATARLDDARAWTILQAAADGPPDLVHALLAPSSLTVGARDRPAYARLVGEACRHPDAEVRTAAFQALPGWAPWSPESVAAVAAAVVDLDERATWRSAANALVQIAKSGLAEAALDDTVRALIAAAQAPDQPDAAPDRDRPARQRLAQLVDGLWTWADSQPGAARATLVRVSAQLRQDPTLLPLAAELLAAAAKLAGGDPAPVTRDLRRLAEVTAGLPALAARSADAVGRRLSRHRVVWEPATLLPVATQLAGDGSHAAGLLAVTLTAAAGKRTGWPAEWRDLLRTLRAHTSLEVRHAALRKITATE